MMTSETSHTSPNLPPVVRSRATRVGLNLMRRGLAACALAFGLTFAMATPALGAKVKKVIKKKKYVVIDMGKDDGLKKGSKICFFRKAKKRKVTCGKVSKVWGNKAYVKVKKITKLKTGMQAAIASKGRKKMAKSGMKDMGKQAPSLLKLNYIMSLATASAYNNVSYKYGETATSLWEPITAANAALLGFGLDYEMPLGNNTLALGGKYKVYTSSQGKTGSFITSNYDEPETRFILVSQNTTALGFFADYLYLDYKISKNLWVKVGNGLDLDMATMTLTADERDDNDAGIDKRIYEATSTATTISLRTVANAYVMFGNFGLGGGINFMIPLTTSLSQSSAADDRFANFLQSDLSPEEDVLKMIDHRKNSFGLEFLFSTFYAF